MSNFQCEKCGTICYDTPSGYITGCEHYPADLQFVKEKSDSGIVPGFLSGIYDVSRQSDRKAIDVTFKYVNTLLIEGRFDVCDEILLQLDLRKLSPALMIAFLTITAPAKDKLPNRPLFYSRVWQALQAKKGENADPLTLTMLCILLHRL